MIGRLAGLVSGLLILAAGFGLLKPHYAARWEHVVDFARLPLAGFDQYRSLVAMLIMAIGLVVALAALQREPARKKTKLHVTVLSEPEQAAPAPAAEPAHDHHDDHGHAAEPAHAEPAHH
jgi:hypothetical protein